MRNLNATDVYAIVNGLYKQVTGMTDISAVDTTSFISIGEKLSGYQTENVLNALTITLAKTIVQARPYSSPLKVMRSEDTDAFSTLTRKIKFYSKYAQPAGAWNTQLYDNLGKGLDNGKNGASSKGQDSKSVASMWEQNPALPLELAQGGVSVYSRSYTVYKDAWKIAFESEAAFASFVEGFMTSEANDLEMLKESYDRLVMISGIASAISMNNKGSVINLTKLYNDTFNTSYTSEELRSTYLDSFLKFFVSTVKITTKRMTQRTTSFHFDAHKQVDGEDYYILEHTPVSAMKSVFYEPLFVQAQASVLPEIFHDNLLDISKYNGVDYWQSFDTPAAINVKPPVLNKNTLVQESAAQTVNVPYVVGAIFDENYMQTNYIIDDANTTPLEARKKYYNVWYDVVRQGYIDATSNIVCFVMIDE